MKTLVENYSFDASAKTVTFNDYTAILPERILQITNVTDGIVIYLFNSPAKVGTVSGNVLTLAFDTTAMADTDDLQIFYDDEAFALATAAQQNEMRDMLYLLSMQGQMIGKIAEMVDGANIRAALQTSAAVIGAVTQSGSWTLTTVTTVSTVTTCSTLTNQAQNGGQPTNDIVPSAVNTLATLMNINNVVYTP